ncbi:unnamed protein product [Amoebophrya sp. A25]|nr:unnamed protein product [Amoebophrya sp. A25]|eukprot:GSA25T00024915001.1
MLKLENHDCATGRRRRRVSSRAKAIFLRRSAACLLSSWELLAGVSYNTAGRRRDAATRGKNTATKVPVVQHVVVADRDRLGLDEQGEILDDDSGAEAPAVRELHTAGEDGGGAVEYKRGKLGNDDAAERGGDIKVVQQPGVSSRSLAQSRSARQGDVWKANRDRDLHKDDQESIVVSPLGDPSSFSEKFSPRSAHSTSSSSSFSRAAWQKKASWDLCMTSEAPFCYSAAFHAVEQQALATGSTRHAAPSVWAGVASDAASHPNGMQVNCHGSLPVDSGITGVADGSGADPSVVPAETLKVIESPRECLAAVVHLCRNGVDRLCDTSGAPLTAVVEDDTCIPEPGPAAGNGTIQCAPGGQASIEDQQRLQTFYPIGCSVIASATSRLAVFYRPQKVGTNSMPAFIPDETRTQNTAVCSVRRSSSAVSLVPESNTTAYNVPFDLAASDPHMKDIRIDPSHGPGGNAAVLNGDTADPIAGGTVKERGGGLRIVVHDEMDASACRRTVRNTVTSTSVSDATILVEDGISSGASRTQDDLVRFAQLVKVKLRKKDDNAVTEHHLCFTHEDFFPGSRVAINTTAIGAAALEALEENKGGLKSASSASSSLEVAAAVSFLDLEGGGAEKQGEDQVRDAGEREAATADKSKKEERSSSKMRSSLVEVSHIASATSTDGSISSNDSSNSSSNNSSPGGTTPTPAAASTGAPTTPPPPSGTGYEVKSVEVLHAWGDYGFREVGCGLHWHRNRKPSFADHTISPTSSETLYEKAWSRFYWHYEDRSDCAAKCVQRWKEEGHHVSGKRRTWQACTYHVGWYNSASGVSDYISKCELHQGSDSQPASTNKQVTFFAFLPMSEPPHDMRGRDLYESTPTRPDTNCGFRVQAIGEQAVASTDIHATVTAPGSFELWNYQRNTKVIAATTTGAGGSASSSSSTISSSSLEAQQATSSSTSESTATSSSNLPVLRVAQVPLLPSIRAGGFPGCPINFVLPADRFDCISISGVKGALFAALNPSSAAAPGADVTVSDGAEGTALSLSITSASGVPMRTVEQAKLLKDVTLAGCSLQLEEESKFADAAGRTALPTEDKFQYRNPVQTTAGGEEIANLEIGAMMKMPGIGGPTLYRICIQTCGSEFFKDQGGHTITDAHTTARNEKCQKSDIATTGRFTKAKVPDTPGNSYDECCVPETECSSIFSGAHCIALYNNHIGYVPVANNQEEACSLAPEVTRGGRLPCRDEHKTQCCRAITLCVEFFNAEKCHTHLADAAVTTWDDKLTCTKDGLPCLNEHAKTCCYVDDNYLAAREEAINGTRAELPDYEETGTAGEIAMEAMVIASVLVVFGLTVHLALQYRLLLVDREILAKYAAEDSESEEEWDEEEEEEQQWERVF